MMSMKVTLSRFCFRNSTRSSKILLSAMACPLSVFPRRASTPTQNLGLLFAEDGFDLALQRLRVERLDDVVVHAGLFGSDDVFSLRLGSDHDEGRLRQRRVRTDFLQEL